jgi:cytochrome b6-f complex iron-sulfur subunit
MNPPTNSNSEVSRREVLIISAAGAAAVSLAGSLSGCMAREEKKPLITTGTVNIGPAADFPAGAAKTKFVDIYGIVIVNSSGDPLAVRPKCTHMGCIAKWEEEHQEFVCPCHGSRYDLVGRVTNGPAKRPLPAIRADRQPDGTLTVDLGKLYAI